MQTEKEREKFSFSYKKEKTLLFFFFFFKPSFNNNKKNTFFSNTKSLSSLFEKFSFIFFQALIAVATTYCFC